MTHIHDIPIEATGNIERKLSIQKMIARVPYPLPAYDMIQKPNKEVYYVEHDPMAWRKKRRNPLPRDLRTDRTFEFLTNLKASKNVMLINNLVKYGLIDSNDLLYFTHLDI